MKHDSTVIDDFDEEPEIMSEDMLPRKRKKQPVGEEPYFSSPEDKLYKTYGIRASLPIRTKVENLHLVFRLDVRTISELLMISTGVVQDELDSLNEEWKRMGKPLTTDEKELQRGRYIAELEQTIHQINDAIASGGGDSRSLSLKMSAMEKRAKLLELDKSDKNEEEESGDLSMLDEVRKTIEGMPSEDLEAMMACLDEKPQSSSIGPEVLSGAPGLANEPGNSGIVSSSSSSEEVSDDWELD